jgi:hypothetical protein
MPPTPDAIIERLATIDLDHIKFSVDEQAVHIDAELSQEELSYLRHNLAYKVKASKITKSISEQQILKSE